MRKGRNITDVLKMNRALVAKTIQKNGKISRAEISRLTGLNKATVTNIVADLMKRGTVRETGLISGESGRRSIALEVAADLFLIISIRLTERHVWIGLFDINGNGKICEKLKGGLDTSPGEVISRICRKVDEYTALGEGRILGIGLAFPGPYVRDDNMTSFLITRDEWQDVDFAECIREKTGLFVLAEQDVDAFTMAEWRFSENYDENASLCCLMVGQTVGGGIIEDGRLLRGRRGIAGEIGHMSIDFDGPVCSCGNRGCLEIYCSTRTLLAKMKDRLKEYPDTVCREDMSDTDLMDAYRAGDPLAVSLLEESGRYLGYGIANIIKIFNPEKIIIGDEYALAGEALLEHIKAEAFKRLFPVLYHDTQIRLSTLEEPVLRGLCVAFMEYVSDNADDFFH